MSNFSSGIISGTELLAEVLRTVVDSYLPTRYSSNYSAAVVSNAGTSETAMDSPGLSVTSVSDDELLLFLFQNTVSCGTIGGVVGQRSRINTDDFTNYAFQYGVAAATGGDEHQIFTLAVGQNYSGTVSLYQRMWRYLGSGTVYSAFRNYHCLQFKKRA